MNSLSSKFYKGGLRLRKELENQLDLIFWYKCRSQVESQVDRNVWWIVGRELMPRLKNMICRPL